MYDIDRTRAAAVLHGSADAAVYDAGLRAHMLRVYNYMAGGLAVSGLTAVALASGPLGRLFYDFGPDGKFAGLNALGWIALFAPFAILLFASFSRSALTASGAKAMYWTFVAIQGVGLGVTVQAYTGVSLAKTFFVTAAAFAALSLYGYTTRKDLSALGGFLLMGLIGLILLSIVNLFAASGALSFLIGVAGVLIFAGLTAYDTQRIKEEYGAAMGADEGTVHAVWSALDLYLNFLNLFQYLLSFMGEKD